MRRIATLFLLLACKSKPSGETAVSGSAAPADAAAVAIVVDAAVDTMPIDAAPPVVEPPTAESVHVEVGRAMRRWAKDPADKTLYASSFGGRAEPDARIEPVGLDAWLARLPAQPKIAFTAVTTWLDPGSKLAEGESKTHVSYFYDGKDDFRELVWKREGGRQQLVSVKTNSRNTKDEKDWRDWRNYAPLDARPLGKQLALWLRTEGDLAWLVVASDKTQLVADLWPIEGTVCELADPMAADALTEILCRGVGEGQNFTVLRDKDTIEVELNAIRKAAPKSTDRRIELARGAKVDVKAAP